MGGRGTLAAARLIQADQRNQRNHANPATTINAAVTAAATSSQRVGIL
jgi:hypothetical protein